MTDYASMTIDNLIAYRDQWPAQRTEWNRADLALQKRLAVKHELLKLAADLDGEGIAMLPKRSDYRMQDAGAKDLYRQGFDGDVCDILSIDLLYHAMISAAPLPASPSSVEG